MKGQEMAEITTGEFVEELWKTCKSSKATLTQSELLRYGHFRGWLEDSDETHPQTSLNRQTAARILHSFMVIEGQIPDIASITPATQLQDLYTCRVCANHIAQVYLRQIMNSQPLPASPTDSPRPLLFFNHLALLSQEEALKAIHRVKEIISQKSAD